MTLVLLYLLAVGLNEITTRQESAAAGETGH